MERNSTHIAEEYFVAAELYRRDYFSPCWTTQKR